MSSFKVCTVMGIPIKLNITLIVFLPVLAWVFSRPAQIQLYSGYIGGLTSRPIEVGLLQVGLNPILIGVFTAVGLFVSVLLHELGHSWTAGRYGIPITSITLWIFGGMAHMEDLPEDWNVEFRVAITGPITSAFLGFLCYGLLQVMPSHSLSIFLVGWLAVVNITLAIFNMLPAFPMDGGRILRALLARTRSYVEATRIAAFIGKGVSILLAVYGVFVFAPLLLIIAMFVYIAAGTESRVTVLRDLLKGMTVREIMSTDVRTVRPDDTVEALVKRILADKATAYPVISEGEIQGFVTLENLGAISEENRESTLVSEVMGPKPPVLPPETDAYEALRKISEGRTDRIVITEDGLVVGTVSKSDFGAMLEVLQGLKTDRKLRVPDGYA